MWKIRHRWEDNIRMDFVEIGWKVMNLIHLTQDREQWQALVNTILALGFCRIQEIS